MRVLLIDADSTIPNLALMKLSTYHKQRKDDVKTVALRIPYFPGQRKKIYDVPQGFDFVYASVIFEGNKDYIRGGNVVFGGTGVSLDIRLPPEIENLEPDYSIYPDTQVSYGFISRGCIRSCWFCKVPRKEGGIRQVSQVSDIVRHSSVRFLDNNFLALDNHTKILAELVALGVKCQFNQGLDIRLINSSNSFWLSLLNYEGNMTFAFDSWATRGHISLALTLMTWAKPWTLRFFVYVHPSMPLSEIIFRLLWLRERCLLPYVMRDISCWKSEYKNFYTDISSWGNQPGFFKKMEFSEFARRRYPNNAARAAASTQLYEKASKEFQCT